MSAKPGSEKNIEIEYLRAIAVMLVVFVHIPVLFPGVDLGQWTGVDLFFCISGYVISRAYYESFDKAIAEGRWWVTAKAFWVRRLMRLSPAAWLWISMNVICSALWNSSGKLPTVQAQLEAAGWFAIFASNFAFATGALQAGRFLWSLSLEDQFYFLFPFFLLLVRGKWRCFALLTLIVLQAIPEPSARMHTGQVPPLLSVIRLDALMWGILIFEFSRTATYRTIEPTILRYRLLAFLISAACVYLLIQIPKGVFGYWVGYSIHSQIAIVSAVLVFLASFNRGYALPISGLAARVGAWIGARSYALYLLHGIVMLWLFEAAYRLGLVQPFGFYVAGMLVLSALLAEATYRFVETPLRRKGRDLADSILARTPAAARTSSVSGKPTESASRS